jgi:hypothetical protein
MQYAALFQQIVEMLHHQLVSGDVFERFRADNLIERLVKLRQIVQITELELQASLIDFDKRIIIGSFLDLAWVDRDAQHTIPTSIGCIGQSAIAETRIESVDRSRSQKLWKKTIAATRVQIESGI